MLRALRVAWLLEVKILCLYLQGEWETPLDLLSFVSRLFCRHSLTSLAGCFREVAGAIRCNMKSFFLLSNFDERHSHTCFFIAHLGGVGRGGEGGGDNHQSILSAVFVFSWSPTDNKIAYWVPGRDSIPAKITIIEIPRALLTMSVLVQKEISTKSRHDVSEVGASCMARPILGDRTVVR